MDEMERLAYQNRFVRQLVQDLTDYEASEATPQVISGPDNLVLLRVSYEEWIKLTSSLFTGADICYPSESDNVRWILYRAVEQPMDLCALIANCIATSEGTQAALRDFITGDPALQEWAKQIINKGAPINPEIEVLANADLDALFGAVTFLVDTINSAIEDFNQDAEAANNSRELGAIIFEGIPILETLPFDEASEYIDNLFEQIIEVYNSQWDTTPVTGTRDRIRCDLFCIARDNGNALTWDLIQDYFYSRTGFTWSQTLNIMLEFANFLQTGTWTGEEVVDIAFGNFAAAMSGMGKFGEMLFPSLTSLMRLGQNDPDPDWEILCDCAPPPGCDGDDFLIDEQGWEALDGPTYSTYHPDEGWGKGTTTPERIGIKKSYGTLISKVTVTFNTATTGVIDVGAFSYAYPPAFGSITHGSPTTEWVLEFTPGSGGIALDYRVGVLDPIPDGLRIICVKVE